MGRERLEWPGYVWLSRVQVFRAAVQVHIQIPGALFSVVVWTSARSDRSDSDRSSSRSGNNGSRSTSRATNNSCRSTSRTANDSYWPARERKVRQMLSLLSRIHLPLPRWGTGLPTERVRRVVKRACAGNCQVWLWIGLIRTKRRSSLMFVGLQRSEVMAKTGFFYPHRASSAKLPARSAKRMWRKPCLGFPLHGLLWSYKKTFYSPGLYKICSSMKIG